MVYLRNSSIGDDDLIAFPSLRRLWTLELSGAPITDRGVASLARHSELAYLFLAFTEITDASISHLAAMKRLAMLNVTGTQLTHAGFKDLCRLLPDCLITHSEFGKQFRAIAGTEAESAWLTRYDKGVAETSL